MNTLTLFLFWIKIIAQKLYPDFSGNNQINAARIELMVNAASVVTQEQVSAVLMKDNRLTPLLLAQEMQDFYIFSKEGSNDPFKA